MAAGLSCPRRRPVRGDTPVRGSRPHTFGWCWDGIACEAVSPWAGLPLPRFQDRSTAVPRGYAGKTRQRPGYPGRCRRGSENWTLEVHVAAARGGGRLVLLRLLRDDCLSGEEQARDGRRVLQSRTGDLRRVDDAGLEHVDVLAGGRVQALAWRQGLDLLHHNAALETRVHSDLLQRLLQGAAHDRRTGRLVGNQLELVEGGAGRLQQRDAAAGHDTLLDRGLGVAHRVLDAVLALLELDLGRRAGLDDGHAAGQLGQPLLQLLAVVVRVGVVDLGPDLVNAAGNLLRVASAVHDRRLVLGHHDLAGPAEHAQVDVVQLEADLLADDLATGEDGDVTEHGLAAVAEARGLHRDGPEQPAHLVDDQGGERLALDVLGDDGQRLAGLHDLVEQREQVLVGRHLRVDDEDVRVLENSLEAVRVGDEVRRDVALVEAHTLGELELKAEGVGLLDGDDAFLADLVHGLGDHLADGHVARRDGRGGGDLLLGVHILGELGQLLAHGLDRRLDAALERHRVGAGGDVAQALAHQRLGEHGRRRRAVAGHVVGLLRYFLDQLGTDLLPRVLELDLLGDGHAIVGDRGGAPLLLENHIPALGAEGYLHGVGKLVHAALEAAPGVLVKRDHLRCHWFQSSVAYVRTGRSPRRTARATRQSLPAAWRYLIARSRRFGCHSHEESANAMFSTLIGRVQTTRPRAGHSRIPRGTPRSNA